MKLFSAAQIRKCDAATIANEPIKEEALMQRAAAACATWLLEKFDKEESFAVFCGPGNNGGDGFALSKLLFEAGREVSVYCDLEKPAKSAAAIFHFGLAKQCAGLRMFDVTETHALQKLENCVIVDALFGTGLSRAPEGVFAR